MARFICWLLGHQPGHTCSRKFLGDFVSDSECQRCGKPIVRINADRWFVSDAFQKEAPRD